MVDFGGARERFECLVTEDQGVLMPSEQAMGLHSHTAHLSRTAWRHSLQDATARQILLETIPHDLVEVKSDPENQSRICGSSSSVSAIASETASPSELAEDARARGQLLQEITRAAETFEQPYSPSPTPTDCYRSYGLDSEPPQVSHAEYIFSASSQWSWSRNSGEEKGLPGTVGGCTNTSLLVGGGPLSDTAITSLQCSVPSHLISDTFSPMLPTLSVVQTVSSVPTLSSSMIQRPAPATSVTTALDLSPTTSPSSQLPPVSTPFVSQAVPADSSATSGPVPPSSSHQLPFLQPFIGLDISSQSVTSHQALEGTLEISAINGISEEGCGEIETSLECSECGEHFQRISQLKCHMKGHAIDKAKGDPLKIEKKGGESPKGEIQNHKQQARLQPQDNLSFICKDCGQSFANAVKLKMHKANDCEERTYQCNVCNASFSGKAILMRHSKVHSSQKPFSCDECKTSFTELGSLKVHRRLHTGEKPFKCEECGMAFSGTGMLATHRRKHTGEKPYVCNDCGERFRLLSTLKSHRRRHTGEKPFVCEICGSSFTQRAALQRHKRTHSDKKPWECEYCGFKFREKENLKKHIAIHKIKLNHTCDICGAGFNQAKKLETHKMLHNGGEKPFQCNKCPSTFTNPKYLTQHKKRVHDQKGAIRCFECSATFKRKETLHSHMRMHKGASNYICEECGAAFNQRGTLTKHLRMHFNKKGIKLHVCKLCKLVLFDEYALEAHVLMHKESSSSSEYSCKLCSTDFPSPKELQRHNRAKHTTQRVDSSVFGPDQEVDDSSEHISDKYICGDCDQTFFRLRQLKAHKKHCPSRNLSSPESPALVIDTDITTTATTTAAASTPAVTSVSAATTTITAPTTTTTTTSICTPSLTVTFQRDKEIDAMKLLTAVLAVTGNDCNSSLGYQSTATSQEPVNSLSPPPDAHSHHRYTSHLSSSQSSDSLYHSHHMKDQLLQDNLHIHVSSKEQSDSSQPSVSQDQLRHGTHLHHQILSSQQNNKDHIPLANHLITDLQQNYLQHLESDSALPQHYSDLQQELSRQQEHLLSSSRQDRVQQPSNHQCNIPLRQSNLQHLSAESHEPSHLPLDMQSLHQSHLQQPEVTRQILTTHLPVRHVEDLESPFQVNLHEVLRQDSVHHHHHPSSLDLSSEHQLHKPVSLPGDSDHVYIPDSVHMHESFLSMRSSHHQDDPHQDPLDLECDDLRGSGLHHKQQEVSHHIQTREEEEEQREHRHHHHHHHHQLHHLHPSQCKLEDREYNDIDNHQLQHDQEFDFVQDHHILKCEGISKLSVPINVMSKH